ncbi:MAG: hypothetical protein SXQ77_13160 [Halobacteria archaeon]|nr:hypothetical protein [Halobacteria archaeon]
MILLVAYNASELSHAALVKAKEFSNEGDEILVVSVVPGNANDRDEVIDIENVGEMCLNEVKDRLEEDIKEVVPDASFIPVKMGRPVLRKRSGKEPGNTTPTQYSWVARKQEEWLRLFRVPRRR